MKKTAQLLIAALKGFAMGAANVVPGVSGGTIALITGIYERLIECIKSINLANLKLFFTGRFKQFWKAVDGNFLAALAAGIVISILSLAKLIVWLLEIYPVLVWAFFFGLVLASVIPLAKDIKIWNWKTVTALVAGIAVGFGIIAAAGGGTAGEGAKQLSLGYIFLCGALAVCTMILPGISGSFVMILLGCYTYVMQAIDLSSPNIPVIAVFAAGAVAGLIAFSHLLSFVLKKYRTVTMAVLTGFMLGSVSMIWPWKEQSVSESGQTIFGKNILPDGYIWQAVLLAAAGFALVLVLERISSPTVAEKQKNI